MCRQPRIFAGRVVLAEIWSPAGLDVGAKKNLNAFSSQVNFELESDCIYTKSWWRGGLHFLLHRELQVDVGSNRIFCTQRVGGGAVCIFFYTESCKLSSDRIGLYLHKEWAAARFAFSSTQRVAS